MLGRFLRIEEMSNNKQSMKLYTEEQVREAIEMAREGIMSKDSIIGSLNFIKPPIELPSNKEITHLQWIYDRMFNVHDENENYDYMLKFKEIIEQLKKVVLK